ncbi:MAG: 30S ribosomal protein S16 [Bacteroidales bacterium]|jgi:small subunit ribosomal protein S16|nr:30S ribosomal protein S16 [Bacteroidales bacterium]
MATRIRLQRHGRTKCPFYHIVIADGRAPRDGRYIERIGYYDAVKVPAEVRLYFDRALDWYGKGAQPSATVRSILRAEGVLLRHHLLLGVQKGALTQEQADVRFNQWKEEKAQRVAAKRNELEQNERNERKKQLEAEKKTNETRLAKIQERNAALLKEQEEAARKAYAEQHREETVAETAGEIASEETADSEAIAQETPATEIEE